VGLTILEVDVGTGVERGSGMGADQEPASTGREQKQVRDAYGVAFFMVLFSTLGIVASGSPLESTLTMGAATLQFVALMLTLRVSGIERRWSLVASAIAAGLVLTVVGLSFFGIGAARLVGILIWLLLTLTTIAAIVKRLVTYRMVSLQLVMGLLVIYMLLGLTFALGYQLSDVFSSPALLPDDQGIAGAVYFSFVTLATLGYGDIVPGNDLARALAIGEALIGQLYLVSVVSLAVSRLRPRKVAQEESA